MNTVLVTTYNRPEMLYLCLEALTKAEMIGLHRVRVIQDAKINGDVDPYIEEVASLFTRSLNLDFERREPDDSLGNNRNTLESYKEEFLGDAEHVFLVEEDVIVAQDFFTWHYQIQWKENPFCSIAARHLDYATPEDPNVYFLLGTYCSIGPCFRRRNLEAIVEHANREYYRRPEAYIREHFPESVHERFGDCGCAQDGLIVRVMFRDGLQSAWAGVPRCFHTGIYGQNRGQQSPLKPGSWRQQAEELRGRWADPSWITQKYVDCLPASLERKSVSLLRRETPEVKIAA